LPLLLLRMPFLDRGATEEPVLEAEAAVVSGD
jgi:hypothetical protein